MNRSASRRTSPAAGSSRRPSGSKDQPIDLRSSDNEDDRVLPATRMGRQDDADHSESDDDDDDDWASAVCSIRSRSGTPVHTSSIVSVSPQAINPFASREGRDAYHRARLAAQGESGPSAMVISSDDEQLPTSDDGTSTIRDPPVVAQNGGIVLDEHDHVPQGFFSLNNFPHLPLRYGFENAAEEEGNSVIRAASPAFSHIHIGSEICTDTRQSVAPDHLEDEQDGSSRPATPPLDIDTRAELHHSPDMHISPPSAQASLLEARAVAPRRSPSHTPNPVAVSTPTCPTHEQSRPNIRLSPTPDLLMEGLPSDAGDSRPPTPPLPSGFNPSPERVDSNAGDSTPPVHDTEQGFPSLKRGFPSVPGADQVERPGKRSLLERMSSVPAPPTRALSLLERIAMADTSHGASSSVLAGLPAKLDFIPKLQDPSPLLEMTQEVIMDADSIEEDQLIYHEPVEELAPYVDSSTQTSPPPPPPPHPIIAQHRETLNVASPLVRMLVNELDGSRSKCLRGWVIAFAHGRMPFKPDLKELVELMGATLLDMEDEQLFRPYSGDTSGSHIDVLQGGSPRLVVFPAGARAIDDEVFKRHKDTSRADVVKLVELVMLARESEREAEAARRKAAADKAAARKAAAEKAAQTMAFEKATINAPPVGPKPSLVARMEPTPRPAGTASLPPPPVLQIYAVPTVGNGQPGPSSHRSTLLSRMDGSARPGPSAPPTDQVNLTGRGFNPSPGPDYYAFGPPVRTTNGPSSASTSSKPLLERMN